MWQLAPVYPTQFLSNLVYGGFWCRLLRISEIQDGRSSTADKSEKLSNLNANWYPRFFGIADYEPAFIFLKLKMAYPI